MTQPLLWMPTGEMRPTTLEDPHAEAQYVTIEDYKALASRLDSMTMSRDSFRAAYEKAHEGDRHEIRLDTDGQLDEIVGAGRFHLEQMSTNEWFLELAGCALWIHGKKVELRPRDQISWAEAQRESLVENRPDMGELIAAAYRRDPEAMKQATEELLNSSAVVETQRKNSDGPVDR